jgi:hypothetical protein
MEGNSHRENGKEDGKLEGSENSNMEGRKCREVQIDGNSKQLWKGLRVEGNSHRENGNGKLETALARKWKQPP